MRLGILALLTSIAGQLATAECRHALALGLDVSGSVDAREYRLQIAGVTSALDHPAVRQAILSDPSGWVELLVYEWSGPGDQMLLLPWTKLRNDADIAAAREALSGAERRDASPGTALGIAMRVGHQYLASRSHCGNLTLDLSGDGKSNLGPRPTTVRRSLSGSRVTINALAIGADAPRIDDIRQAEIAALSAYFRTNVIMGDDAFVETALGYDDYAAAMARKLERELQSLILSERQ